MSNTITCAACRRDPPNVELLFGFDRVLCVNLDPTSLFQPLAVLPEKTKRIFGPGTGEEEVKRQVLRVQGHGCGVITVHEVKICGPGEKRWLSVHMSLRDGTSSLERASDQIDKVIRLYTRNNDKQYLRFWGECSPCHYTYIMNQALKLANAFRREDSEQCPLDSCDGTYNVNDHHSMRDFKFVVKCQCCDME